LGLAYVCTIMAKKLILPLIIIALVAWKFWPTPEIDAASILEDKYAVSVLASDSRTVDGQDYIAGVTADRVIVLKNVAKIWQEIDNAESNCSSLEFCLSSLKIEEFNDRPYLYINHLDAGSGFGTLIFTLIDLGTQKEYHIGVSGPHNRYENIEVDSETKANTAIYDFLLEKVEKSDLVYRPSGEDLNKENPKNASTRWLIDNEGIHRSIEVGYLKEIPLKFKSYNVDLVEPLSGGATLMEFDNKNYHITSIFKGPVVAYNKTTKDYFILWVPADVYDWVSKIDFVTDSKVRFYDRMDDKAVFDIDLRSNTLELD